MSEKISRRKFLKLAGAAVSGIALVGCGVLGSEPEATPTPIPPTETPTPIPPTEIEKWLNFWPDTPTKAAKMFGGKPDQWQRNPEWPDSRVIDNPPLGVYGYPNREWRIKPGEPLPFSWPKTPEEAAKHFFPSHPNLDLRFIQPAWIDPETGIVTGWHLSEDHWLVDGTPADLTLNVHPGEVAEGYTANGTQDPKDDRNWVVWGGSKASGGIVRVQQVTLAQMQGCTIWMPGTDPNSIALRMELYPANETPFYKGPNGEQLGPIPINFTPVYPAPDNE